MFISPEVLNFPMSQEITNLKSIVVFGSQDTKNMSRILIFPRCNKVSLVSFLVYSAVLLYFWMEFGVFSLKSNSFQFPAFVQVRLIGI